MGWMSIRVVVAVLLATSSFSVVESIVYMILLDNAPVVHYSGSLDGYTATAPSGAFRIDSSSLAVQGYAAYLRSTHDQLLSTTFPARDYTKLYSYYFLINGFAVDITEEQAARLLEHEQVTHMEVDTRVRTTTTHTPDYLGLPQGAWPKCGGVSSAGEDIVIGLVDTGINPIHPSFANDPSKPYGPLKSYKGSCEEATEFPKGSCNYKLIGARHFSAAAEAAGVFNATEDFASPLDGDGHGTHTASTAGGNHGVPVVVNGLEFGLASGIAPRARVAMYKALYRYIGGFFADVVAAIDQAVADGVDILSLSIGPAGPPDLNAVYFSIFDIALLGAVRAGVFVTQAAGNEGPFEESVVSFSPWIVSVAASSHDRNYTNTVTLGNGKNLVGTGFAAATLGSGLYTVVLATDVATDKNDPNNTADECQSSDYFDKKLVVGNILVCYYTLNFAYGVSSMQAVSDTAKNLSATGVVLLASDDLVDNSFALSVVGYKGVPTTLITTSVDKKEFFKYYNASTNKIDTQHIIFGAKAKLSGTQTIYTGAPPVVADFSSRGPDYNNVSYVPADVLKPNVMAPGVSIWAGWSPIGVDVDDFVGEDFALISGTSMATPHIAGIAALVKERNPSFSPAAIHSALAGTAFSYDNSGLPLQAEYPSANVSLLRGPATAFDMGSGQVNATVALDPGLVFEAGINDYVNFLCHVPAVNSSEVRNATGAGCEHVSFGYPSDLNTPYISIGVLEGSRQVPRTVTSVGSVQESYVVELHGPANVSSSVTPTSFSITPGRSQHVSVTFKAEIYSNTSTFGSLHFLGSAGHHITIPITISLTRLS